VTDRDPVEHVGGRSEPHEVAAADGYRLAARRFLPAREPRGGVIVAPAMGVDQAYYRPLAEWLSGEGFAVATFDYRGTGASRRGRLRGFATDIFEWARLDATAVLEELARRVATAAICWIGHSLGGQIFPLLGNRDRVQRLVTVAAGSGYWRENASPLRRRAWWLWYFVAPLAMALVGYFPGKRLGIVGDLPLGVMKQWRRWCIDPRYLVGAEGPEVAESFAGVTQPVIAISFTDDDFMSRRNVESLHGFFTGTSVRHVRLRPEDVGARRIGHFGFFRRELAEPLWRPILLPALAGGERPGRAADGA
jgi:predicted alpha/beta hydrolase